MAFITRRSSSKQITLSRVRVRVRVPNLTIIKPCVADSIAAV